MYFKIKLGLYRYDKKLLDQDQFLSTQEGLSLFIKVTFNRSTDEQLKDLIISCF